MMKTSITNTDRSADLIESSEITKGLHLPSSRSRRHLIGAMTGAGVAI